MDWESVITTAAGTIVPLWFLVRRINRASQVKFRAAVFEQIKPLIDTVAKMEKKLDAVQAAQEAFERKIERKVDSLIAKTGALESDNKLIRFAVSQGQEQIIKVVAANTEMMKEFQRTRNEWISENLLKVKGKPEKK